MRRLTWFLGLLLVFVGAQGTASPVCDVIESLQRIHFAQHRLSQDIGRMHSGPDRDVILRETTSLTTSNALFSLASQLSSEEKLLIAGSLAHSHQIAQSLRTLNAENLIALTQTSHFQRRAVRMERLLPRFDCQSELASGAQGGSDRLLSPFVSMLQRAFREPKMVLGLAGAIMVFAGFCIVVYKIVRARIQTSNRMAKRFDVNLTTHFVHDNKMWRGDVLDISCNGIKLRHGRNIPSIGDDLDIWLIDDWQKGRVTWSNDHYCGVNFRFPLLGSQVKEIRKQRAPTQPSLEPKTAPL